MKLQRNPHDLTHRYGPRRLRGRRPIDGDESPLDSLRSPAFWASAVIMIAFVILSVRAICNA